MRDAAIRARLAEGDEDSVINFLLFGVTFTSQPRISERDLDQQLSSVQDAVDARVSDLARAVATARADERIALVRMVASRKGIDGRIAAGQDALRKFLHDRLQRFVADREAIAGRAVAAATRAATDPASSAPEVGTLFSERGLSSDTTIYVDFGVHAALDAIRMNRVMAPASVRRVGIVGPGLDFTDKREGYDFYPPQTLQPFAVIDSLTRLGLARAGLRVTTFDLSPRINAHINAARERARRGSGYVLQLPRETTFEWNPLLVKFWEELGDRIGSPADPATAPPGVQMRAVLVRPEVVRSITAEDVNVVLQRVEPLPALERYDVIVATNILVYYDVFEQSLAMANLARMLKPGGILLTNSPVFELPSTPMRSVGFTDVLYEQRDAARDRIFWYQRQ
jgi:SAM-dependent methyltransferase